MHYGHQKDVFRILVLRPFAIIRPKIFAKPQEIKPRLPNLKDQNQYRQKSHKYHITGFHYLCPMLHTVISMLIFLPNKVFRFSVCCPYIICTYFIHPRPVVSNVGKRPPEGKDAKSLPREGGVRASKVSSAYVMSHVKHFLLLRDHKNH